jgi:four helix bundle protein
MQDFKNLKVWEKSHQLAIILYRLTRGFPREEIYGLTSQIRRSATSIGANIAEGCGRGSNADMARFLQVAMGSACELEYHLLLSRDLELICVPEYQTVSSEVVEIKRMLTSLLAKVRTAKTEN